MIFPSRLAFAAKAEDDDALWPLHVESNLSLEEEKIPVDKLLLPAAISVGMGTF